MTRGKGKKGHVSSAQALKTFRAGCGREWSVASAQADLAYTEQAFPECPTCPHRVEPDDAAPFCTLRPVGTRHPFAELAGLKGVLGD